MPFVYIIIPFLAVFIAQISKFFITNNRLHFSLKNLVAYSGMPSSHAALTVSLSTIIALREGLDSPLFALSLLFTLLVLRDALGIRQYIGKQGQVLNELVEDLGEDEYIDDTYPVLVEKVGHTPIQLIIGALVGFLVALVSFYYWPF